MASPTENPKSLPSSIKLLYAVFFVSGFPALLYQLVWQRKLFTIYGINIESITVVVTAFMLGLGLGSLLGGLLSRSRRLHPLMVFAGLELGIGLFGFFSLWIFDLVAVHTLGAEPLYVFVITFSLVLLPTLFMGATLPVLVNFLIRHNGNVGESVGVLYCVNTLGSAAACLLAALFIFALAGLSGTVALAASLNLLICVGSVAAYLRWQATTAPAPDRDKPHQEESRSSAGVSSAKTPGRFGLALLLVGLAGFIALSYEILWARFFIVSAGGHPKIFPIFLGFFLAGLAYGSLVAHRYCRRHASGDMDGKLYLVAKFLLAANVVGFLVLPALAWSLSMGLPTPSALPWVALASAMMGATLPLLSHFGIDPGEAAGSRLSFIYLANIIGSAAGSLVTGFVLMEIWSARTINVFLGLGGLLLCAGIVLSCTSGSRRLLNRLGAVAAGAVVLVTLSGPLFDLFYERLHFKVHATHPNARLDHLIENRSGVIAITGQQRVFGGGVYDGTISTSLVDDRNKLFRAYAVSALHPAPRHVLSIGMGSGSWAQVLAHHPQIERLTIVEINPGYVEMLAHYPDVRSLLNNPKVEFVIDDGRRWLSANPEQRFDVIVQNTTFYWRSYSTNLLSQEFFEKIRAHLKDGGLYYFNSTWSAVAQRTAASVFPYAYRFSSMMAASDSPIRPDRDRLRSILLAYRIDGAPVLTPGRPEDRERLSRILALVDREQPYAFRTRWQSGLEGRESILERTKDFRIATDDNMATEWVPDQNQEGKPGGWAAWLAHLH